MNLQESIKRILREELSPRVRRRIPYDEMEKEFLESFELAYDLTKKRKVFSTHFLDELIYSTITTMMDGVHWRFVSTLPEDEFWYDDIHKELENHYRDRITQMYNERRGIEESILRENDYSPAGKEVIPSKIVVHKSNPMFRDKILQDGLKVKAGECYKIYVGDGTKCKPAIFATNSTNKRAWFDSTYDDDIWEINTEMIPDVKWYKDRHYDSKSKHIVTFQDIPREAITLKYEGTGSGDVKKWDKDSPNLYESIRRILKETLESEWNKGNYDYQHGYCHYFAYNIIDKIKKKFPKKDIKYYLLLASEVDKETQEPIQEYLIHVYIKIDDLLLDSNGFTTQSEAWQRAQEWEQRQSHLVPEEYETEVWEEESDEIPEYFFNNSFCNTKRVKQDLKDFLSHPSVQKLLVEK